MKCTASAQAVMTYVQASAYLGLPSVGALRNMVYRRSAPPSIAFGKRDRRFRVVDMEAWLFAKAKASGAQESVDQGSAPCPPRRRGRPTKSEQIARRDAIR